MKKAFLLASMLCCCTITFGQAKKKSPRKVKAKTEIKVNTKDYYTEEDEEPLIEVADKEDQANETVGVMEFKEGSPLMKEKVIMVKEKDMSTKSIFETVETMPEYPGGYRAMLQFLGNNLKYPKEAEVNGIEGRVVCQFVVEADGSVNEVRVARGIDPMLDNEAVRVIKLMPKWTPGMQDGKAVRVRYTLPISFRLPKPEPKKESIYD